MSAFWGGFAQTILDQRTDERKAKLAADLQRDLEERRQIFQQIQEDTRTMARRDERAMDTEWENIKDQRNRDDAAIAAKAADERFNKTLGIQQGQLDISRANAADTRALRRETQEQNALYRAAQAEQKKADAALRLIDDNVKNVFQFDLTNEQKAELSGQIQTALAGVTDRTDINIVTNEIIRDYLDRIKNGTKPGYAVAPKSK